MNSKVIIGDTKKEKFNLQRVLTFSTSLEKDIVQIASPDKIDEELLKEFRNRQKTIKLVTIDKKEWNTKVIGFDKEFLYVRVPSEFRAPVGELMLASFPTEKGNYVVQTFVHQIKDPVLVLKFQDPRKDRRFYPPSRTFINYAKVNEDTLWLLDKRTFVIRTTGKGSAEHNDKVLINETIGLYEEEGKDKKEVFTYLDDDINRLKIISSRTELDNISIGGCAFAAENDLFPLRGVLYVSMSLDLNNDVKCDFKGMNISMFGVVKNILSCGENRSKYGVSFLKRFSQETINNFLMIWEGVT
ncbi:MAG: hypothetical protein HZA08_11080 [Nitrospirae bacterium]|nr:hypothetical protein [Nitrospirota bacterium]